MSVSKYAYSRPLSKALHVATGTGEKTEYKPANIVQGFFLDDTADLTPLELITAAVTCS